MSNLWHQSGECLPFGCMACADRPVSPYPRDLAAILLHWKRARNRRQGMRDNHEGKKPLYFLTPEFWAIECTDWKAPFSPIPVETTRRHLPLTVDNLQHPDFWKVLARTWEPKCRRPPPPASTSAETALGFWQRRAWSWEPGAPKPASPEPPVPLEPPKELERPATPPAPAAPPAPPDPVIFYYRRAFEALRGGLAPYDPHPIQIGSETFPSAAHLYWAILFSRNPDVLSEVRRLRQVEDHDESVAQLLRISLHFKKRIDSSSDERLAIMEAVQALKTVHHTDVLEALLSTGDAPLHYMQASKTGEASKGSALDALSARLFSDSGGSSRYGEFGKPLPPNWTSLLHPDDTFWGIDPSSGADDENSNHLGRIMMTLRDRFRQKKAEMVMMCGEMEKMIIAAYGIGQAAQPEPVLEDPLGPWPEPALGTVQTPIDPIIGNDDVLFAEDELGFHLIEAPAPSPFMRPYRSAPDLGASNARHKPPLHSMSAAHYLQYSGSRRPPSCVRPHPAGSKINICCPTCCYRRCCCGVASCVCSGVCLALCCCNCTCFA